MDMEAKLKAMINSAQALNPLLSVIREEDYLVVEHEDYGHITELHLEDYPHHKEILRESLSFASAEGDTPPWLS